MGRSPGEGNGNLLQYSCLGNPTDRGAWWATVCGVTKVSDMTELLNNNGPPSAVVALLPAKSLPFRCYYCKSPGGVSCMLWKTAFLATMGHLSVSSLIAWLCFPLVISSLDLLDSMKPHVGGLSCCCYCLDVGESSTDAQGQPARCSPNICFLFLLDIQLYCITQSS